MKRQKYLKKKLEILEKLETIEIDLGQSNLKYPNQPQNFNSPDRVMSGHYRALGKEYGLESTLGFNKMKKAFCFTCVKAFDKNLSANGPMKYALLEMVLDSVKRKLLIEIRVAIPRKLEQSSAN